MNSYLLAVGTLLRREVVRFLRQPNRLVGALATPLIFWFFVGSGIGRSFKGGPMGGDLSYLQYFFPGTILMILLFTAIFSTISIIEDRREGFLQAVLVAPVPRSAIVLGKLLGGTALACFQALLFMALAPLLGIHFSPGSFAYVALIIVLLSFGITGLGLVLAWRTDSIQGFHAIMNLILMPLWFLSGALFPPSGAPPWLRCAMKANPLTYGVFALHRGFYQGISNPSSELPSAGFCVLAVLLFALAMWALSTYAASKRS